MRHYDYEWDLSKEGIILDSELNTDKLGWSGGDYFKFVNIDGKQMLVRLGHLQKFIVEGVINAQAK